MIKKRYYFILAIIGLLVIVYVFANGIYLGNTSQENITKDFKRNMDKFINVTDYMKNNNDEVFIDNLDWGKYSIKSLPLKAVDGTELRILVVDDKKVNDNILYILNKLGYRYIMEKGLNGIYFLRQTGIKFERGVVFSKNGSKPDLKSIYLLQPICDNWYYYEAK